MNFSTFTLKWYFFFQHFPQTNYGGGGTVLLLYSFATIDKMLHAKNHSSFLTNEKSLTHAHKKKKEAKQQPSSRIHKGKQTGGTAKTKAVWSAVCRREEPRQSVATASGNRRTTLSGNIGMVRV